MIMQRRVRHEYLIESERAVIDILPSFMYAVLPAIAIKVFLQTAYKEESFCGAREEMTGEERQYENTAGQ